MARLDEVKRQIDEAQKSNNSIHMIYLNSYGNIENVGLELETSQQTDEGDWIRLRETAGLGRPYFEICTIDNGAVELQGSALRDSLETAIAERTRFYTEREETYGSRAWPQGVAIGA